MWTIRILHLIFERVNEKKVQLFAQFLKLRLSQSGNCCSGSFLRLWNRTYCAWNYFYSVLHQVWHLDKFFLPREKQVTKKLWGSEVRQNGIFSCKGTYTHIFIASLVFKGLRIQIFHTFDTAEASFTILLSYLPSKRSNELKASKSILYSPSWRYLSFVNIGFPVRHITSQVVDRHQNSSHVYIQILEVKLLNYVSTKCH